MAAVNSGVLFLSLRFVAVQCMCTFVLMLCMDRTGVLLTFQSGIMVWVLMKINVNATSCISGLPSCLAK